MSEVPLCVHVSIRERLLEEARAKRALEPLLLEPVGGVRCLHVSVREEERYAYTYIYIHI